MTSPLSSSRAPDAAMQHADRANDAAFVAPPDATPMMAQYLAIKSQYRDCLLFYRMGDFYEMFFTDAEQAAAALDIALTKRGKHQGADIPMCGVPVHSHENYLARLIRSGFKVAVCEQVEDPAEARKRGAKSVVGRAVVRLITAGTLTEDSLLEPRRHNFLAAVAEAEGELGLAWLDISTGVFRIAPTPALGLAAQLARIEPGEVILSESLAAKPAIRDLTGDWRARLTPLPSARFHSDNARRRLEVLYGVRSLDGFGQLTRAEVAAAGALIDYVALTQQGRLPGIARPVRETLGCVLDIDPATRRNLELVRTMTGERAGSLLGAIDRTMTGAGGRLLAERLAAPLTDREAINERLDAVACFIDAARTREDVRRALAGVPDLERALARLSLGRGGPRDLGAVRDACKSSRDVRLAVRSAGNAVLPAAIEAELDGLGQHDALIGVLDAALAPELPVQAADGGFIAAGYAPALDESRTLRDESRRLIAALQSRYAAETGIAALKIRHNNVLGYFIEVPARHADRIPLGAGQPFIHRQTMAGAVRYSTVELGELEHAIARAADRALALERDIFDRLTTAVMDEGDAIRRAAAAFAALDVAAALAQLAVDHGYTRPVVDGGDAIEIEGGRHPVVEAALVAAGGERFVPNDCALTPERRVWLLTGPNMAGKSTFLRQVALIVILAQMGSFVPATRARIGVADRVFSRVGAADDLARGRSTFMVEMVETAAILNQAGPRALVILDEIGRGTATFDGLSIAWAVIEHLHEVNRARALFATHYHELTALTARLSSLACHSMQVKEWKGDVVFLHSVGPGAADRSYGIHVARLAGLPPAVISRAEHVLAGLERGEASGAVARLADDLPLFAAAPPPEERRSPALAALDTLRPDEMSPREALDVLYRLVRLHTEN